MFESLVRDMKKAEGVTEQLKAANQWEWIRRMENIQNRAREIVKSELIYVKPKKDMPSEVLSRRAVLLLCLISFRMSKNPLPVNSCGNDI